MKRILFFIKKETVLVVAILLAVISMIFIPPDQQYPEYIDFRTLGILFGLMTCVAGVQQLGVFDRLAGMLLRKVSGRMAITSVLVMLCFFSSMLLTNDVALITFVPFSLILLQRKKELFDEKMNSSDCSDADHCGKFGKYADPHWQSAKFVSVWIGTDEN